MDANIKRTNEMVFQPPRAGNARRRKRRSMTHDIVAADAGSVAGLRRSCSASRAPATAAGARISGCRRRCGATTTASATRITSGRASRPARRRACWRFATASPTAGCRSARAPTCPNGTMPAAPRRRPEPADASDPAVWAISCFFLRTTARGQGLTHRLVAAGIDHARNCGARRIEACPIDISRDSRSIGLFVGSTRVFEKAGFTPAVTRKAGRPLMRLEL